MTGIHLLFKVVQGVSDCGMHLLYTIHVWNSFSELKGIYYLSLIMGDCDETLCYINKNADFKTFADKG